METNDALEELGYTDGYNIPRLGPGLNVSRAPSKLSIGSESNKYPNREPRKEYGCTGGQIAPRIHVRERMKSIHARKTVL
jgi:hypothetical protein